MELPGKSDWEPEIGTTNPSRIVRIENWGTLALGDTDEQFSGCMQLTIVATDTPDLSFTTSLQGAFQECRALTGFDSIRNWDTSGITNMSHMFEGTVKGNC
ncbi:MAG: BspA family leucine-rich repeat surface protein [Deltaproteobacteria bacterium]|nr:BspA family leucine-rich repeat surface protein [Deltaproteobacteria bacterium]